MKNWNFTANEVSQSILSPGLIYLGYREQTPLQWEKRKKKSVITLLTLIPCPSYVAIMEVMLSVLASWSCLFFF